MKSEEQKQMRKESELIYQEIIRALGEKEIYF